MTAVREHFRGVLLCCLLLLGGTGAAQEADVAVEHCNGGLQPVTRHRYGYQLRDDRCEGQFVQPVAGKVELRLASFTASFEDYDLEGRGDLLVAWNAPDGAPVRLRATGLRRRLYYRMDTRRPSGSTSYTWPSDVLRALNISREDLGVVAWTSTQISKELYLPLRITQREEADRARRYRLALWPRVELDELYMSLAEVDAEGEPSVYLMENKPLEYGYYPAERPIVVSVNYPKVPGIYYLEFDATLRRGGSITAKIMFFHPGPSRIEVP